MNAYKFLLPVLAVALSAPIAALAAGVNGTVQIDGNVAQRCLLTSPSEIDDVFDLGTLVDRTSGRLLPNLKVASKTFSASFCNTHSIITVSAVPMTAQSFTATPPDGFSASVNYTATALGWTQSPATFATGAASNPDAVKTTDTAFAGDIMIDLSGFSTVGGDELKLVSDPVYQGMVTVTLAVAN